MREERARARRHVVKQHVLLLQLERLLDRVGRGLTILRTGVGGRRVESLVDLRDVVVVLLGLIRRGVEKEGLPRVLVLAGLEVRDDVGVAREADRVERGHVLGLGGPVLGGFG